MSVTSHLNSGYLNFRVYSESGIQIVASNDDQISNNQTGVANPTINGETGTYYIKVTGSSTATGNYDIAITGIAPDQDTDMDLLYDAAEYYHGTQIAVTDTDSDGKSDNSEVLQGTTPLAASEYIIADVTAASSILAAIPVPVMDAPLNAVYGGTATWYAVNLVAGQGITTRLKANLNTGYLNYRIYNANSTLLVSSDDSQISDGQTGQIEKKITKTGMYYIKVGGSTTADGNYDLVIYNTWYNAGVIDAQRDYHSTKQTCRYVENANYLVSSTRVEWYRFVAEHGSNVNMSVTSHLNSGYLNFQIFNEQAVQIAASSDTQIIDNQTGVSNPTILGETGTYYLKVTGSGTATGNYDIVITGIEPDQDTDTDLLYDAAEYYHGTQIAVTDTDSDGTSDNSEVLQGTNPLAASEYIIADVTAASSMLASIPVPVMDAPFNAVYGGTATWYAVNLVAGQGITTRLKANLNTGYLNYRIYNANSTLLVSSDDSQISDGQTGIAETTVSETGIFYINVFGTNLTEGNYTLTIYNAWFNEGTTDCQRNDYFTFNISRHIVSDNYIIGDFRTKRFRFRAETDDLISISLTAHLNTGYINFDIHNEAGTKIAASNDSRIYNNETGVVNLTITEPSGVYYLKVNKTSDACGNYNIIVTGIEDSDDDAMLDAWELKYFCSLERTGPNDWDNDRLTDKEEHDLFTHPKKQDTEDDGMPDGWEVDNDLDPLINDCGGDPDNDFLINCSEYIHNTFAQVWDTEEDGMPDGWEVVNNLNPLVDDCNEDPDQDLLSNCNEYDNGTDPHNKDTDSDKMPDGYEANNGLNPLSDDAYLDKDLDNFMNIREYIAGTSAANKNDIPYFTTDSEDFETGNLLSYHWLQIGNNYWNVTDTKPYLGEYALESADINDGQVSSIEINLYCEKGEISFWYTVESEEKFDFLNFYIDGVLQDSWSGLIDFTQTSYLVSTGMHNFRWTYEKNDSVAFGADKAWIDGISFPGNVDTDFDLLPDGWELDNHLNYFLDDALGNSDTDMYMNLKEYYYDMNPKTIDLNPGFCIGIDMEDSDVDGKDLSIFINGLRDRVFKEEHLGNIAVEFGK
jgi:hypothetical protein